MTYATRTENRTGLPSIAVSQFHRYSNLPALAVELYTCILKGTGSILGQHTTCTAWGSSCSSSVPSEKYRYTTSSRPRPLPSICFAIHQSLSHSSMYDILCRYLLTYYLLTLSWAATWFAASQEIPLCFTEPEGSLPHSQASATCLYPGPAQSSPYTHIPPPGDPS